MLKLESRKLALIKSTKIALEIKNFIIINKSETLLNWTIAYV